MRITAGKTPKNVYVEAGMDTGVPVHMQNQSPHQLRVYAGDSAPSSPKDYFILSAWQKETCQGAVVMYWSEVEAHAVMVQEKAIVVGEITEVSVSPGDVVEPGHSVFGPFGRLVNATDENITVGPTDPPTANSLQGQGFTVPETSVDQNTMTVSV